MKRVVAAVRAAIPDARIRAVGTAAEARRCVHHGDADWLLVDLPSDDPDVADLMSVISDLTLDVPVITIADTQDDGPAMTSLRCGAQDHVSLRGLSGPRLRRALVHARERHARQRALLTLAFSDPVTGLPNRALFMDRLRHALARAPRGGGTVAVMFVDLDHFKPINDRYGHAVGDTVLAGFAEHLLASLRPSDTVARYGGDEFTILCEDVGTADDVLAVAHRVTSVATAPLVIGSIRLVLQVSVGAAFDTETSADADELVARADAAMYEAKAHAAQLAVSGVASSTALGRQQGPPERPVGPRPQQKAMQ